MTVRLCTRYLTLPLVNVSSSPVADDDLGAVEEVEVVQQEGNGEEGQGGRQDGGPWRLLDPKQGNHDDLEEHHCCDDVLEDLHPQLHQTKGIFSLMYLYGSELGTTNNVQL